MNIHRVFCSIRPGILMSFLCRFRLQRPRSSAASVTQFSGDLIPRAERLLLVSVTTVFVEKLKSMTHSWQQNTSERYRWKNRATAKFDLANSILGCRPLSTPR